MKKNKTINLLFSIFLVFGCVNCINHKDDKRVKVSENKYLSIKDSLSNVHKNKEYFSLKKNTKIGIYDLVIETNYKNDTLADDIPLEFASPVIIKQKLFFKKNDTIIRSIDLPFEKIEKLNRSRKNIEIAEMSIWLIYSIAGIDGTILFGICGTGLCLVGNCPEYSALFSENGDVLTECYSAENKSRNLCVEQDILKKYGITDSTFRSAQKKGTLVDIWR